MNKILRDELDLRRRHILDALDDLMAEHLHRRVAWWRQQELVDEIEHVLEIFDAELLRELKQS
jgi:hypothetical protein